MAEISERLSFVFTIAIGIVYAGCGGPRQVSTPLPASAVSHDASRPLPRSARSQPVLYISDEYNGSGQHNNAIDIFPLTGPHQRVIGSISAGIDGPWGLSVDANNSLYVANGRPLYNNRSVTVYPFGSSTPSMTYSKGLHQPLYAVADSAGHVFVSDREVGGSHPLGYVVEYKAGTNAPKKVVRMG
jgi:DNA-binding beta-propeller fold protein YncE